MPVVGFKTPAAKPRKRYSSDPKTRAAELVAEGKLGRARPGAGRPRKHTEAQRPSASSVIADALRDNADLAASVVPDVLRDPNASDSMKLRAVKLGLRIEDADENRRREDEREGRRPPESIDPAADHSELVRSLVAKLAENPMVAHQLAAVLSRVEAPGHTPPKPF
jgi:hypothetical protein